MADLPDPSELQETAKDAFTRRAALSASIYALVLAISSLGGSNATKTTILSQQESADKWAYYQAKAAREHLYRSQRDMLEAIALIAPDGPKEDAYDRIKAISRHMEEEQARLNTEKVEIRKEAERLEAERDRGRAQDPYFDYSGACLQIALVLASVSIVASSRLAYGISALLALLGTLLAANGFTLLVKVPFIS